MVRRHDHQAQPIGIAIAGEIRTLGRSAAGAMVGMALRAVVLEGAVTPGKGGRILFLGDRVVRMGGAVRDNRGRLTHPLEAVPDARRNDHQRVVVRPEKDLGELALGRGFRTIVVQDQLDPARHASVIERHLAMPVPALDHVAIDGREVDLTEPREMRVGAAQHVHHGAPLIGNPAQRDHLHSVDHQATFTSGTGMMKRPPSLR